MKRACLIVALILAAPLAAAAQAEGYGTVYFYRGRDTQDWPQNMNVLNPEAVVYLDGKEFLSMPEHSFVGFKMPAGRYVLSMKRKGTERTLYVRAGATHYLHVEQTMYPYARQIIYTAEERTGIEAVRRCSALREKKIKLKEFEAVRTKPAPKKQSKAN